MCCCNAIGLKIFFRRSSAKWNFLLCAINVYKNSRVVRGVFHVGAGLTQAGACPLPRRNYDLMVFKKVQFDSARMPFPARHHLCSSSVPFQLSRLLEVLPVTKKTLFVSKIKWKIYSSAFFHAIFQAVLVKLWPKRTAMPALIEVTELAF